MGGLWEFSLSYFRKLFLLSILASLIYTFPSYASFPCYDLKDNLPRLMKRGYGMLATAEIAGGAAIIVMLDRSGNFKIIGVDSNIKSCEIMSGNNWRFIADSLI